MTSRAQFGALFLIASSAFAQHGGALRGSSPAGIGHGTRSVGSPAVPRNNGRAFGHHPGVRQRFGNGYIVPYYPFLGDYAPNYLPEPGFFPAEINVAPQPAAPAMTPQPAPVQTAQSVIQEYNWKDHGSAGPREQVTFTIALKDGSTRSAVVTWVQGRTLHYTDSDDKQGVLAAALIDRDATRRLNREKNLSIQLPPG